MSDTIHGELFQLSLQASKLLDERSLEEAKKLALQIEDESKNHDDSFMKAVCQYYAAPLLIDVGAAFGDDEMIKRGTEYLKAWIEKSDSENVANDYYNLANGYHAIWKIHATASLKSAIDTDEHLLARRFYRLAAQHLHRSSNFEPKLGSLIWTNYGNTLDQISRGVEAISAYDQALIINPNMGMALGNKGVALSYFAPMMQGYRHLFYLEAIRLLELAQEQPDLTYEAKLGFDRVANRLNALVEQHEEMKPESVYGIQPKDDFHTFLCEFSSRHSLFLNPVSFLGKEKRTFYGDPLFITTMYSAEDDGKKFARYVTFLNEIKQDYVLGRYLLVQSQYQSKSLDVVDEGVTLYYTLDYALYGIYIQLLKGVIKQAIAVLDKVAYFIYDYCQLPKSRSSKISFLTLWGDINSGKISKSFKNYASPHLFALFTLARDMYKQGDWNRLFEYRHSLTHRFLVLHDIQPDDLPNDDIPRELVDAFLNNTIFALKIARAAVMYLILFVEDQEYFIQQEHTGYQIPVYGVPLDKRFRYRPDAGE